MRGINKIHLLPTAMFVTQYADHSWNSRVRVNHTNPNKLEVQWAGEKGRGLFTKETVKARAIICEYKVAKTRPPFPQRQRPAVEKEYEQNGKGCYILEARDNEGKWWCFDATHRLNQYGRYINHAPGSMVNAMPVTPTITRCSKELLVLKISRHKTVSLLHLCHFVGGEKMWAFRSAVTKVHFIGRSKGNCYDSEEARLTSQEVVVLHKSFASLTSTSIENAKIKEFL